MASTVPECEPECPKCGYVLLGLTEHRCPECGAEFSADFVETFPERARLLAWERRELGGFVRRFLRTLRLSAFAPARHFRDASARTGRRMDHPCLFLGTCIALALVLHLLFLSVVSVLSQRNSGINPFASGAVLWDHVRLVVAPFAWSMSVLTTGIDVAAIVTLAAILRLTQRSRLGAFRVVDLAALLAPAVVLSSILLGVAWISLQLVTATLLVDLLGEVGLRSGLIVLGGAGWYFHRAFAQRGRAAAAWSALWVCAVHYGVSWVVGYSLMLLDALRLGSSPPN